MPDNPSKNGTAQVVEFPNAEEKARRLRVEVERLSRLPVVEWMFYLPDIAKKHGIEVATLRQMIEAVIKDNEKKTRAEQVEQRRIEARAEKKQTANRRESERKQERDDKRDRQDEERACKEAERAEREQKKREAAFAEIADLPKLTHEARLKEAAARLGEDLEILMEEFEVFLAAHTIPEALQPWDEPVDVAELLGAIEAKFRRYVVASDAIVTASTLYAPFTYIVEVTTHAP